MRITQSIADRFVEQLAQAIDVLREGRKIGLHVIATHDCLQGLRKSTHPSCNLVVANIAPATKIKSNPAASGYATLSLSEVEFHLMKASVQKLRDETFAKWVAAKSQGSEDEIAFYSGKLDEFDAFIEEKFDRVLRSDTSQDADPESHDDAGGNEDCALDSD